MLFLGTMTWSCRNGITTMSVYDGAYEAIVMATPDVKHLEDVIVEQD